MNTVGHWNEVWEHDYQTYNDDPRRDIIYQAALAELEPGSRVLDVGGGCSKFAPMALDAGHKPLVVDYSDWAIQHLEPGIPGVCLDVQKWNGESLGEFEAAVCLGVLEHLEDDSTALAMMAAHAPLGIVMVPNNHLGPAVWGHLRCYTVGSLTELMSAFYTDVDIRIIRQYLFAVGEAL